MMIEVDGLCRVSGGRRVLDDVTFRVNPGEIVGFLGQNGAGKTTTLRILAGVLPKTGGTARIAGFESALESAQARRRIGYLPENVPVIGNVTALEYVEFVARGRGATPAQARHEAAARLEQVDLTASGRRAVGRLSKGQRQRVGLAAALACDPDVLLLDEPSSGLDPSQLARVRSLIREQRGRRTVLLSTHILSEVRGTCDRVVVLHHGRVVAEEISTPLSAGTGASAGTGGSPGPGGASDPAVGRGPAAIRCELVVRGERAGLRELVESVDGVRVIDLDGEHPGEAVVTVRMESDRRAELASALVHAGRDLVGLSLRETSLEEMFLRLVAGADDAGVRS